jgi:hypothetical protein
MPLDAVAVRQWVQGMRDAEQVAWRLEAKRLRSLSVFESVLEYCHLRDHASRQGTRDGGETWHRRAAADYGRLLEVFRKAAERSSGR